MLYLFDGCYCASARLSRKVERLAATSLAHRDAVWSCPAVATILDLRLVVNYELPGRVEPMSLLLFNRAFYPNLVRATIAGNGVTMAGSFLTRFSQKAWLLFPFGGRGFGALGDVVFNTCVVFALICVGEIIRQSYSTKRRLQVPR